MVRDGFLGSIGNTPLIRLKRASDATGCEILGKAEFLNPGGSVKDRAALGIIEDAEASGRLRHGGVIVEGTAGNTGIGLALVGNARGYRTVIVMPETQSQEKKDFLRLIGADLRLVPAKPYRDPGNYVRFSERLAGEIAETEPNGAIWANQFDNVANRDAHRRTTGPEIWAETGGKVDGFTCSAGTGGTIAGVAMALKAQNPKIRIVLADPMGSAFYNHYTHGELRAEGSSITEGIGNSRITKNLEGAPIDAAYQIPDDEALPIIFEMVEHEGLVLGGSTGINVAAAIRLARELGRGHTIVTILADGGARYQSKLFNPVFLREKGLPIPRLDELIEGARRMAESTRTEQGRAMRRRLMGEAYADRMDKAVYDDPIMKKFGEIAVENVFGGLWVRPGLDVKTRTLICVISDTVMGREAELAIHLRMARREGWSEDELVEGLLHLSGYCGLPLVREALIVARKVFAEMRAEG